MKTVVMTKKQAVRLFGSEIKLADALGLTRQAVNLWKPNKPIPDKHALRIYYELKPEVQL